MKWFTGGILSSVIYGQYTGVIQQLEGKWDLYVAVHLPDGKIINQEGLIGWEQAQSWVESEINKRISNGK